MRQLGGSFGISIVNTYSARRFALHRVDLISNITPGNPVVTNRLNGYTGYLQSKGISLIDAKQKAMEMIDLSVVKQSTLLSYLDAFLLIGLLFVCCLPLLLFVIKRSKKTGPIMVLSDH